MTVTAICEYTKNRAGIFIDDEFAFVLYKGELRHYRIEAGAEIPDDTYWIICREVLPKRARLRCMNLLKNRRYTEKQLYDKLMQGDYPAEIAAGAIDYVKSYGYVDDEQYARDYIGYRMESQSKSKIRNDLQKKGIDRSITDRIWTEIIGDGDGGKEKQEALEGALILHLLKKRKYDKNTANLQEKSKMFTFLYRKGFSIETIKRFLSLDIT